VDVCAVDEDDVKCEVVEEDVKCEVVEDDVECDEVEVAIWEEVDVAGLNEEVPDVTGAAPLGHNVIV